MATMTLIYPKIVGIQSDKEDIAKNEPNLDQQSLGYASGMGNSTTFAHIIYSNGDFAGCCQIYQKRSGSFSIWQEAKNPQRISSAFVPCQRRGIFPYIFSQAWNLVEL